MAEDSSSGWICSGLRHIHFHVLRLWNQGFIPFYGQYIEFGVFYIPFVILVVVAMANSVNLTDGLDGLCSGVTAIVSTFFAIIAMQMGQNSPFVFCTALSGVCLGFLIFNKNPAETLHG